ncbi:hypothetical protein GUITHDRAFT_162088 [Guillardia theta CCMP2712]|uniref:Glutathione S-transferase n=2 Tax=Guillardia theta TaxID=55529 RepID=L1JMQ1_GUITC|nr:hypothetical protein GUITHDRAFT_162088 [Guillardia theta CCMP2712]EKX49727.1 hypothetical protein GUITHDRAFT_162088 [Guillardia theta CCMP2712]|eukprot:XP_005836707.1 hypothetical protein GUITHDRAFT_162088 [Guillardia theta CCMP2712]
MSPATKVAAMLVMAATAAGVVAGEIPKSLSSEHDRIVVSHRPQGATSAAFQLHYFCLQGLGELPRLILEISQTPYDSVMYFTTKEYKSFAPFGQMPVLHVKKDDGSEAWLAQSGAIVRYLSKKLGLSGATEEEESMVDMVFEGSKDIMGKKPAVHEAVDSDSTDAQRLRMYLEKSEGLLGSKQYFVGDKLTYADVGMFHALYTLQEVGDKYLDRAGYKSLSAFVTRMASLPSLSAYLSSERRVPLTEKELGKGSDKYIYTRELPEGMIREEGKKEL